MANYTWNLLFCILQLLWSNVTWQQCVIFQHNSAGLHLNWFNVLCTQQPAIATTIHTYYYTIYKNRYKYNLYYKGWTFVFTIQALVFSVTSILGTKEVSLVLFATKVWSIIKCLVYENTSFLI